MAARKSAAAVGPCARFPQMSFCACTVPCQSAVAAADFQEVDPGVFIGSLHAAFKHSELARYGIKCIVDISAERYERNTAAFNYLIFDDVFDIPSAGNLLRAHFETCNEFIASAMSNGDGVLIHCVGGVSGAPALAIAYLVGVKKLTVDEALARVKSVRPRAQPNAGFMQSLRDYELSLKMADGG